MTTIQARVRLLVVACILPAWLLAVAVSYFSYERQRDSIVDATVQTARSLTQGVERELATSVAVLRTLANSTRIEERDYVHFRKSAALASKQSAADNIVLFDAESQELMAVARSVDAPQAQSKLGRISSVIATGQPAVSDFFVGEVSRQPQIAVAVPVIRDDKVIGRLDMVLSPGRFADFLQRQRFPPDWTVSVFDSQGIIVARNRAAESFVGKPGSASLLAQMRQRSEGSSTNKTLEGLGVISCFSRSNAYGWSVAVGVPEELLTLQLKRTLLLYALGGLPLLGLGLLLANRIGRSMTQPIQALVAPALAIGRGETAAIEPSDLLELTALGTALKDAQGLLRQRELAVATADASSRDSQARLRRALDASQIGEWNLDLKTGVINHSLRHDQCFGYTEPVADWNVESFFSHLHPDDRQGWRPEMAQELRLRESFQREFRIIWPDGSLHWIAMQGVKLSENGVPTFIVGLVSDITDRKQNEELRLHGVRLEAENRQIQESNRIKSEFLANMSHELRTPLNAIIGFADILRSASVPLDPEKQQAYLGHVATSGRHLLQLINDLLDLSKVESGKFEFFPEPVNLPRIVQEVIGVLHAQAARKNITLLTEHDSSLNDLVLDPSRLKQVLYNFLSNAIKFTGSGGRVVLRSSNQGPDHLRIEVEDTGIGIAPADQLRLFNQFQQIRSSYAKPHHGTGLGLALTKRLAELQGGSVGVRSVPGVGSVFYLVLPCRADPGGSTEAAPVPEETAVAGGPKVLVIEDEAADQALLVQILHTAGFEVDLAASAERALELARKHRYDAITLDLLLPDRSGLDVLAALRAEGQNSDVPVVVVTMATETSALAGFQISDVLTKPIRPDEIIAAFRRAGLLAIPTTRQQVLVVDDDPAALELMAAALNAIGMSALCVSDGAAALASLDIQRPAAIVLDLLMPGMNGFDVLHALRRHDLAQVPVFIWTSMTLSDDEIATLARTAQAVVAKGQGSIDALAGRIQAWGAVGRDTASHGGPPS